MTRFVTVLMTLALLAGAVSPVAAHQRATASEAGDVCPMMSHQPAATPCVGEPCPCNHGGPDGSMLPDGVILTVPEPATSIAAPVTPSTGMPAVVARFAAGFSAPLDHPPYLLD